MHLSKLVASLAWIFCVACAHAAVPTASSDSAKPPEPGILTPAAGPAPLIHGPTVYGERPGAPFLYYVPATGDRPLTFTATGLPAGLTLDAATGRITGSVATAGEYPVTLHASNAQGTTDRPLTLVIGDQIALTPPMGWSSWNCWGASVDQDKVLSSAQAIVDKGLANHGWSYVNIDDGWQGPRGGTHNAIQPNSKFPDMAKLATDVHGLGLKFGIYSTPWALSYAGFVGGACENEDGTYDWIKAGKHDKYFHKTGDVSRKDPATGKVIHPEKPFSFATNDAAQFADWGVDYLKYDWYLNDVESATTMSDALRKSGRDVVFSLSNSAPFEHAADWQRVANCWRTTGDIEDSWQSMTKIGFNQEKWIPFAGPGHWNDTDMLIVGSVGWGKPHPTALTQDEQYTHISLWCLLSAPLLLGCDVAKLDDFTVSLLTNDEVLDIDQDSRGIEVSPIAKDKDFTVYAKPLADGSYAVGLFNLSEKSATVAVKWADLKLSIPQKVRDLWRQKDLGNFPDGFSAPVDPHGVLLIRVSPVAQNAVVQTP
jgi:alpha-galactosidase